MVVLVLVLVRALVCFRSPMMIIIPNSRPSVPWSIHVITVDSAANTHTTLDVSPSHSAKLHRMHSGKVRHGSRLVPASVMMAIAAPIIDAIVRCKTCGQWITSVSRVGPASLFFFVFFLLVPLAPSKPVQPSLAWPGIWWNLFHLGHDENEHQCHDPSPEPHLPRTHNPLFSTHLRPTQPCSAHTFDQRFACGMDACRTEDGPSGPSEWRLITMPTS